MVESSVEIDERNNIGVGTPEEGERVRLGGKIPFTCVDVPWFYYCPSSIVWLSPLLCLLS